MTLLFRREHRFLHLPLGPRPRLLLVAATAVLALTLVFPLWNMTMFAPQYQEGLRLDIYASGLQAGNDGQDLKEINLLNHYIGMRDLSNENFAEFQWMPFVIGALGLLFLRAAVLGEMKTLVDAIAVYLYFAAFSLWSFAHKLYAYGHELAPTAAVTVDPFMPPVFGSKQLANFEVYSYPAAGSYTMLVAGILILAAGYVAWRDASAAEKAANETAAARGHRRTEPARAAGH
jgi:hypothetical protein